MKNEAAELLSILPKKELKNFDRFILSPYFNKNTRVYDLYRILVSKYFRNGLISSKELYSRIYPGRKYKDSTLRSLYHNLKNIIIEYLIAESLKKKKLYRQNLVLEELFSRKADSLCEKYTNKVNYNFTESRDIDADYFYNKNIFLSHKYSYNMHYKKMTVKANIESTYENLDRANMSLTLSFLMQLCERYLTSLSVNNAFNAENKKSFTSKLMGCFDIAELLSLFDDEESYCAKLYEALLNSFKHLNELKYYANYKKNLQKNIFRLSCYEKRFHYFALLLNCSFKLQSDPNSKELFNEQFSLYKYYISEGLYKISGREYLDIALFKSVVFRAVSLQKYTWLKNFLDNYSAEIEPEFRENLSNLSYSYYYYGTGNLEHALYLLNLISIDYFIYKYDIYILKTRISYELKNYSLAESVIKSFREVLKKERMMVPERKQLYINYIYYFLKLLKYKKGKIKLHLRIIKESLLNEKKVINKDWMLQKINEIESG